MNKVVEIGINNKAYSYSIDKLIPLTVSLKDNLRSPEAYYKIAMVYSEKEPEESVRLLEKARGILTETPSRDNSQDQLLLKVNEELINRYIFNEDHENLVKVTEQMTEDNIRGELWAELGTAYELMSNYNKSIYAYKKAVDYYETKLHDDEFQEEQMGDYTTAIMDITQAMIYIFELTEDYKSGAEYLEGLACIPLLDEDREFVSSKADEMRKKCELQSREQRKREMARLLRKESNN